MKVFVAHNVTHRVRGKGKRAVLGRLLSDLRSAGINVCDPEETVIPHHNYEARFNYCLNEIASADFVVVDASTRVGLGVGAEMMFAKEHHIAVFAICPKDSYYRKTLRVGRQHAEWLHPFIHGLASRVFESVEQCVGQIRAYKRRR